jgi:hypothetical protein
VSRVCAHARGPHAAAAWRAKRTPQKGWASAKPFFCTAKGADGAPSVRAARNGAVRAFGTVAVGAAAAAGALSLTKQRQGVAAKELFNSLVGETDPTALLPGKARARRRRLARRPRQLLVSGPTRRARRPSRPPQRRPGRTCTSMLTQPFFPARATCAAI